MAFAGLVFVIVGETSASRDELEKKIKAAEGTVAKAMRKNVSAREKMIYYSKLLTSCNLGNASGLRKWR